MKERRTRSAFILSIIISLALKQNDGTMVYFTDFSRQPDKIFKSNIAYFEKFPGIKEIKLIIVYQETNIINHKLA